MILLIYIYNIFISEVSTYVTQVNPVSCDLGLKCGTQQRLTLILSINTLTVIIEHLSVTFTSLKDLVSFVNTYRNFC